MSETGEAGEPGALGTLSTEDAQALGGILERLRGARSAAVLTGAGVSAESGIPTFRDPNDGLWSHFDPRRHASVEGWEEDPRRMWGWYGVRRDAIRAAQPNPAHHALRRLEAYYPDFTLLTQNIDTLHRRAGSEHILELHGNIFRYRCSEEDTLIEDTPELNLGASVDAEAVARGEGPEVPRCPRCGGRVRPDVVWFGEGLDRSIFTQAAQAAANAEVFFVVGTSAIVEPAASLPRAALRRGALVIELNPEPTSLSDRATLSLRGSAGAILPPLVDLIAGAATSS